MIIRINTRNYDVACVCVYFNVCIVVIADLVDVVSNTSSVDHSQSLGSETE